MCGPRKPRNYDRLRSQDHRQASILDDHTRIIVEGQFQDEHALASLPEET